MEGKKAREKDGKVGSECWLGALGRSCSPVLGAGTSGLQESPQWWLQSHSVVLEGHVVAS